MTRSTITLNKHKSHSRRCSTLQQLLIKILVARLQVIPNLKKFICCVHLMCLMQTSSYLHFVIAPAIPKIASLVFYSQNRVHHFYYYSVLSDSLHFSHTPLFPSSRLSSCMAPSVTDPASSPYSLRAPPAAGYHTTRCASARRA